MDFFDQRRTGRPSRYPAPDEYEDGPPPYDEYAPCDGIGTEFGRDSGAAGSRGRGRLAGAVTGLLATAVAAGVANFTAAFIRPQASPISAVSGAFIDRAPAALRHLAAGGSGGNGQHLLLFGLFVAIALIAMAIGMLAWRRTGLGAAAIGLLGLTAAYVAVTRPGGRATDAIPSIAGGLASIAVIVWLVRAGTRPEAGEMPAYDTAGYDTAGYDTAEYESAGYDTAGYGTAEYESAGYDTAGYGTAEFESAGYDAGYGSLAYGSETYGSETYETAGYEAPAEYDPLAYGTAAYGTATSEMPAYRTGRTA